MTNILKQNYQIIKSFSFGGQPMEMKGNKLKALFKLIENKGELIETDDNKLSGLKALAIADCEYIAINRTAIQDSFYPCILKTYLLTSL